MGVGADRHRHLFAPFEHRRGGKNGKGDVPPLPAHHRGDPCAFGFGVDAGVRPVHAGHGEQLVEGAGIITGEPRVIPVQRRVIGGAFGRHQGDDAGGGHRVGDIAEILLPGGAGAVDEQACGAWPRRADWLAQDGGQSGAILSFDRQCGLPGAICALMVDPHAFGFDGGIGRFDSDMVFEGHCPPLGHHHLSQNDEHCQQSHRSGSHWQYSPPHPVHIPSL